MSQTITTIRFSPEEESTLHALLGEKNFTTKMQGIRYAIGNISTREKEIKRLEEKVRELTRNNQETLRRVGAFVSAQEALKELLP